MLFYVSPVIFSRIFWASLHAASRAHRSCHSVSSWDRSSKFWGIGVALLRITWANHSKLWILVSNVSVTCISFCEFYTLDWFLHVWALPSKRWRLRRLHILECATQLSCIWWAAHNRSVALRVTCVTANNGFHRSIVQLMLLQHSCCTFVIILFGPFSRLIINLAICIRALFLKSATTLGLVGVILNQWTKRNDWSFEWYSEPPFVWSLPIRQEILNVSQIGKSFHGICPPIFHPDLIATILQMYFLSLCVLLSQQSHLHPIRVVSTCNDFRTDLRRLCQIPRNCQCKWL